MSWLATAPHTEEEKRQELERLFAQELTWLEMRCDQVEAEIRDARRKGEGDELENEWGHDLLSVGCADPGQFPDQEAG